MTPHPPHDTPWDALARHFAGELSKQDADALRRWIDADPARPAFVEELRSLWADAADLRQSWDAETALRQIKQTPARPVRVLRLADHHRADAAPVWRRAIRLGVRVAAAVALVAGGVGLWRAGAAGAFVPQVPATSEVSTPRGQRAILRLPDGTEVVLAPASTIRYAVAAARGPRTVHLEGGAYITVRHDEARPFTVHTAHGVATDLGTRFVVQAYPEDSAAIVVVAEGEVSLRPLRRAAAPASGTDSLLLAPGDRGVVTLAGRLSAERGLDVSRYVAWTSGRLEFHDTPMSEVALALGRWYDLDVRLADSAIARKRLTASFKDEPVSEVLQLIEASLGARVSRQAHLVTIGAR